MRNQLLKGLLGCDLIGFHTYEYARHFISACTQLLGLFSETNFITAKDGHRCEIGTFPIGIEPEPFFNNFSSSKVRNRIAEIKERVGDCKVIIGIDRLDYIKGVPQKLYALDQLLTKRPDLRGKVTLIQVAVPTRTDVLEYQQLKVLVEGLVGQINGKHGI